MNDFADEYIKEIKNEDILAKFGQDFSKDSFKYKNIIVNDDIFERLALILQKPEKNTPLLIGKAGTGKTAIMQALAYKIAYEPNTIPSFFHNKKIIGLSLNDLQSGTWYVGIAEHRTRNLIRELEQNPNIIVFLDEFHVITSVARNKEQESGFANALKPALARGSLKLVGATTNQEYKKYLTKDKALLRRLNIISIQEPDRDAMLNLLFARAKYYKAEISKQDALLLIDLSNKYLPEFANPDKSIDILQECITSLKQHLPVFSNKYKQEKENELKHYLLEQSKKQKEKYGFCDAELEFLNKHKDELDLYFSITTTKIKQNDNLQNNKIPALVNSAYFFLSDETRMHNRNVEEEIYENIKEKSTKSINQLKQESSSKEQDKNKNNIKDILDEWFKLNAKVQITNDIIYKTIFYKLRLPSFFANAKMWDEISNQIQEESAKFGFKEQGKVFFNKFLQNIINPTNNNFFYFHLKNINDYNFVSEFLQKLAIICQSNFLKIDKSDFYKHQQDFNLKNELEINNYNFVLLTGFVKSSPILEGGDAGTTSMHSNAVFNDVLLSAIKNNPYSLFFIIEKNFIDTQITPFKIEFVKNNDIELELVLNEIVESLRSLGCSVSFEDDFKQQLLKDFANSKDKDLGQLKELLFDYAINKLKAGYKNIIFSTKNEKNNKIDLIEDDYKMLDYTTQASKKEIVKQDNNELENSNLFIKHKIMN